LVFLSGVLLYGATWVCNDVSDGLAWLEILLDVSVYSVDGSCGERGQKKWSGKEMNHCEKRR